MTSVKKLTWSVLASFVGLGLLAGCSGTPDPAELDTTGPERVGSSSPEPEASPSTSSDDSTPQASTPAQPGNLEAGFAAVALAESEVPGSKAISLDWDDDQQWDVEVFADGTKTDFTISGDGTKIIKNETDDDDDTELADRVAKIQVPLPDAVRNAIVKADGTLDQVELDTHNGTVAWEVELDTPNGDVEVYVDAATGDIL